MNTSSKRLLKLHTVTAAPALSLAPNGDPREDHSRMYGLILEGVRQYVIAEHGENVWHKIAMRINYGNGANDSFEVNDMYEETLVKDIAIAAIELTGIAHEQLMENFGRFFVSAFIGHYGFDEVLRVLGRHLRDFLNGLDNLHEYMKLKFPLIKAPSFFCVNESRSGLTLQYRSRRAGYVHYVKGQIKEVARMLYNTEIKVELICENEIDDIHSIIFRLHFDNSAYSKKYNVMHNDALPVPSSVFFHAFPFNMVINRGMKIINIGRGLHSIKPDLKGKLLHESFELKRPIISFTWESILMNSNNTFEIVARRMVSKDRAREQMTDEEISNKTYSRDPRYLILRGQMMYLLVWDAILFLGTPVLADIDDMFNLGLYINDLSMHDFSRDMVLAGSQQQAELKLALDQEQSKSKKLEENMKRLDEVKMRSDMLLYQMIPKVVADRLRAGEPALNTCQVYEDVTILFTHVVGFAEICDAINPLGVVTLLNNMYTVFDNLTEKHAVYKVETISDQYMIVSGAPITCKYHAAYVSDVALEMRSAILTIADPSKDNGQSLQLRIGMHSGMIVGGIVGLKTPRYCLFGDTVNTASRMESTGMHQMIQITEATKKRLDGFPYMLTDRGEVAVKGKGQMKTYWLNGKREVENETERLSMNLLSEERKLVVRELHIHELPRGSHSKEISEGGDFGAGFHSRVYTPTKTPDTPH